MPYASWSHDSTSSVVFAGRGELLPEGRHPAHELGFAVDDVVEGDQPAGPHERAVLLEVRFHALVVVIAVDEEEVDAPAPSASRTRASVLGSWESPSSGTTRWRGPAKRW